MSKCKDCAITREDEGCFQNENEFLPRAMMTLTELFAEIFPSYNTRAQFNNPSGVVRVSFCY